MHLEVPENKSNDTEFNHDSSVYTDNESEVDECNKIIQKFERGSILHFKSNVYQVNSAAIIKAPVMAVNTDNGFSF